MGAEMSRRPPRPVQVEEANFDFLHEPSGPAVRIRRTSAAAGEKARFPRLSSLPLLLHEDAVEDTGEEDEVERAYRLRKSRSSHAADGWPSSHLYYRRRGSMDDDEEEGRQRKAGTVWSGGGWIGQDWLTGHWNNSYCNVCWGGGGEADSCSCRRRDGQQPPRRRSHHDRR